MYARCLCFAGEIAAIANCTAVMTDPEGPYNYTASQAQAAFKQLSLYTNAESCPMVSAHPARACPQPALS